MTKVTYVRPRARQQLASSYVLSIESMNPAAKIARHRQEQSVSREIRLRMGRPRFNASVEWRLLLAASAADPDESDCVRGGMLELEGFKKLDWETVLRLSEHHGTSSLLHRSLVSCGDVAPADVLESLRQRYETNVRKSLFLARELIRILDRLDALSIEAIPYKGMALSEAYYGDMTLRQAGDIDLFVRRQEAARAKRALSELGYTPRIAIPEDAEKDYVAAGYEWAFDSAAGKNLLELQWALQPHFYAVDFDMEGLFQRAMSATVAGRHIKALSPEDLLLVLAVHAAKHAWGRLIWLCDIAQIVKKASLDWELVQTRAHEVGIERILHVTLLLANRFLALALPSAIMTVTVADSEARALADEVALAVASGLSYEEENVSYFRLMMRLRERRMDRLRFLTRLTFTPGPGDWKAVRLPRALFPLYRVVRLGRLAARLARGLQSEPAPGE